MKCAVKQFFKEIDVDLRGCLYLILIVFPGALVGFALGNAGVSNQKWADIFGILVVYGIIVYLWWRGNKKQATNK